MCHSLPTHHQHKTEKGLDPGSERCLGQPRRRDDATSPRRGGLEDEGHERLHRGTHGCFHEQRKFHQSHLQLLRGCWGLVHPVAQWVHAGPHRRGLRQRRGETKTNVDVAPAEGGDGGGACDRCESLLRHSSGIQSVLNVLVQRNTVIPFICDTCLLCDPRLSVGQKHPDPPLMEKLLYAVVCPWCSRIIKRNYLYSSSRTSPCCPHHSNASTTGAEGSLRTRGEHRQTGQNGTKTIPLNTEIRAALREKGGGGPRRMGDITPIHRA